MAARIGVITNLRSRRNRSAPPRTVPPADGADGDVLVRATTDLAEVRRVVEEFIDADCRYWVADGGDGTLNCLMNEGGDVLRSRGLWDGTSAFPVVLVPANGGTIDFVARKAGIRGRSDRIVPRLAGGLRRGREPDTFLLPTLRVEGHRVGDPEGTLGFDRLGFATALGGIGQKFFETFYESPNPNPWTILEIAAKAGLGHAATFLPFRGPDWLERLRGHGRHLLAGTRASVVADGRPLPYEVYQGLHVGSVDVDFGTMKLFPFAGQPGKLHLVAGSMDRLECAWKWIFLVAGRPVPGGTWHEFPGECLEVRAADGEVLEPVVDGETFGGLDYVRVRPGPSIRVPRLRTFEG